MWLSTRTRPDISYATSRCAQEILAHPAWVIEQATQVWKYLKNTPNEGLKFGKEKGEGWDGGPRALEVFTDSSFAANPETQASHGSVMVTWNGSMMFWKSGKQAFPALSTAESELLEAIEGLQTGDAVDCLTNEREDLYKKTPLRGQFGGRRILCRWKCQLANSTSSPQSPACPLAHYKFGLESSTSSRFSHDR